jgi:hypothetical protein
MRHDLTLLQINALKTMLRDSLEEDEQLWLDTLEGETDAFELTRKLLDAIERDEGEAKALTEQMANRKARRDRCEARIAAQRDAIMALMDCAKLDKLPLPEATLSLRKVPASLKVNATAAVPDEYCTMKPVPSMDAIKAAFEPGDPDLPNWLRTEPERPSLTIRRK